VHVRVENLAKRGHSEISVPDPACWVLLPEFSAANPVCRVRLPGCTCLARPAELVPSWSAADPVVPDWVPGSRVAKGYLLPGKLGIPLGSPFFPISSLHHSHHYHTSLISKEVDSTLGTPDPSLPRAPLIIWSISTEGIRDWPSHLGGLWISTHQGFLH
jgi:hypothetical protein